MEFLNRAPFAEITSFREVKPCGTKMYQIRVDHWRNNLNNGDRKEPYKALPGDLFVVAHGKPETVSDLQNPGKPWAFASITNITGEGNSTQFKVKASKELDHKTPMFVVFLMNLIPVKRIWEALHMPGNLDLVKKVLQIDSAVKQKCNGCSNKNESSGDDKLATSLSSKLNDSQTRAVLSCLHMLNCKSGSAFELIWGPPGTGKTKTITTLLVALLRRKCKTLVCAPTNVAITEVASRVVKTISEAQTGELFFSLGDILLFGTRERLNIGSDVEAVYLDHRMEKLEECFGPFGWNNWFGSMIDLLKNCVSRYQVESENDQNNESRVGKKNPNSFLEYFRERFDFTLSELKRCVSIIITHTPESYIAKRNVKNLALVIGLLDSFRSLLFENSVASEALEDVLRQSEAIEESSRMSADKTSLELLSKRNKCLSVLETVRHSLNRLDFLKLKKKQQIKKFCFETASLIFCTVSCSSKLHKMKFKPTILVIDEAAQLKESESTIPLQLPGLKHAILVGDEWQLPATVKSKVSMNAGFGRSLFERLSSQNHPKHLLNVQYRMNPSISCFPNSEFYRYQIQDADIVKQRICKKQYLPGIMFGPYSFINIIGGRDEKDEDGHSRKNIVEVAVIAKIVQNLHKAWCESKSELSIGIISPYAAQVRVVQYKLQKYVDIKGFQVKVKTVDGFQGGEEDIIIMSTVCSRGSGPIDFISVPQRVNVALTRARQNLWILGDERTLVNSRTVWCNIVVDAKNRGCVFNADQNKDLAKAITDAKKESGQFDDLLNANNSHIHLKSPKWKVLLTDNFLRSVKRLPTGKKKLVKDLLIKLSDGQRPMRHIMKQSESSTMEIRNFKIVGLCATSTVDIEQTGSGFVQVLRIWDLLPTQNIPELSENLDCMFKKYTDAFTNLCNEKTFQGKLEIPTSWSNSLDVVRFKDLSLAEYWAENSGFGEISLGMKFYTLSDCVLNHLLSNRDVREMDLLLGVPDQQKEIILFQKSAFILGRSGTGKTTVLTMKLFQNEYLHGTSVERLNGLEVETRRKVLRQLFVTSSPRLCNFVKQRLSFLRSGNLAETGPSDVDDLNHEEIEFKNIPHSFRSISPDSYPLIITFRQFLLMLDGTLSESYFKGFFDVSKVSLVQNQSSGPELLEFIRTKEVDHARFSTQYWPRLDSCFTKKLDSSTVFTEIISHIKGGAKSMEASDGKLTREDYVTSTKECGYGISRKRREMIYDIFEVYEQMKMENREFDLADFANYLQGRSKHERYEGDKMDFVYVDEVQDLTMSQFTLFRHVCRDVEKGFAVSGDTLKANARAVGFRIQDMKSLFDKRFVPKLGEQKEQGHTTSTFHLTQNFRAHSGILKLSQSVIELLYHFFPLAIDIVEPETTNVNGETPVLLQSINNEDALSKLFGENGTGFGAKQVIMVRDESGREKIKDRVGKKALILTMLECQDLEFKDVLLYNFFGSSPLKKQWQVIYNGSFDSTTSSFPHLDLDNSKQNIFLAELKQLHVVISSTKQRLWILDDIELSKPMFDCWKTKCLVQIRELNDSLAREMKVSSTTEDWKLLGIKLYNKHNYNMAAICFEKACEVVWETKCKAGSLVVMADRARSLCLEEANSFLHKAAEMYLSVGETNHAAKCFSASGDYESAGRIYLENFELRRAGECFSLAGCYKLAADVYAKGNLFTECLDVCVKGKLFDVGFEYLRHWKQHANKKSDTTVGAEETERIRQEFLETCALHYHEVKDRKLMMKVLEAFVSTDLRRNFLKSKGCLDELVSLEEKLGNFVEAAKIAKLKGDVLRAADLLGKAGKFKEATKLILPYVLANSLWSLGKNGWPLMLFKDKDKLLSKAKLFAKDETEAFYGFVCIEADVMENKKRDLVTMMNQMNDSQRHESIVGEILSARRIVDAHLASTLGKYFWGEEDLVLDVRKNSRDVILKDRVSVESLVYFWNIWKEKIVGIFEYLRRLEIEDFDEVGKYGEFCMSFLGVWRQFDDSSTTYFLLNSDASWARNAEKKTVRSDGDSVSIDACQFVSAAQSYWSLEVLSVGFEVLRKLEALYVNTTPESDSLITKCRILILIHEVAKFLSEFKFLKKACEDSEGLQKFITLSIDGVCGHIFPFDRRTEFTENLCLFRETDYCKNLLKQVTVEYIKPRNNLSHGKIGTIAMIILGSGKPSNDMFENVLARIDQNLSWKAFFKTLSQSGGSNFPSQDLILRCQEALSNAYNARLGSEDECISPGCFVYLAERLLIWASSFQSYFLTSRSSFVEWLVYEETGTSNRSIITHTTVDFQVSLLGILRFVIDVIQDCLRNKGRMIEWIKRCTKSADEYYSVLVTRMVVMVCLIHTNFGMGLDLIFDLLGRSYVSEHLPLEFCDAIKSRFLHLDQNVLAEAFKKLGNPLVIVSLRGDCSRNWLPDGIVVDMKANRCKNDILRALFPEKVEALKGLVGDSHMEAGDSCRQPISKCSSAAEKSDSELPHSNLETNSQTDYAYFWKIFESMNCEENRMDYYRKFASTAQTMKVDVEKRTRLLIAAMNGTIQGTMDSEVKHSFGELCNMVDEMKELSAALDTRDPFMVEELSKKLQSRRPRVDPILNKLFHQHKTNHHDQTRITSAASTDKLNTKGARTARTASYTYQDKSEAPTASHTEPKRNEKGACHIL